MLQLQLKVLSTELLRIVKCKSSIWSFFFKFVFNVSISFEERQRRKNAKATLERQKEIEEKNLATA